MLDSRQKIEHEAHMEQTDRACYRPAMVMVMAGCIAGSKSIHDDFFALKIDHARSL